MINTSDEKRLYSEVIEYFRVQASFQKEGKKEDRLRLLQLAVTLPVTAERLLRKNTGNTIDKLLPRKDIISLLFTRSIDQMGLLSMSVKNLLMRCRELGIAPSIILELEKENRIFRIHNTDHYEKR